MQNTNFIVYKNDRLNFEESYKKVEEFITKRLNHFNAKSVHFINKTDVETHINQLANSEEYIVVLDCMNPIIDIDLIKYAKEKLKKANASSACADGAIPGTQFEYILSPNVLTLENPIKVRCFSQDVYNNQFNLYKFKRLKMFLTLLRLETQMHTYSLEEFMNFLSKEDIFERLAAFGEDIPLHYYKNCPHCQGELVALPMKMSQAFCGYIPSSKPLYHECIQCNLVLMSPYIEHSETYRVYDKFDKQDFVVSHSNPYNSTATRCDFSSFINLLPKQVKSLDLGGGIGSFSKFLKETYSEWDVTHSDFAIKQNKELEELNIHTRAINFLEEKIGTNSYDLITAWEVVEHAPYEKFSFVLENIYEALKPDGLFVFSTPNFDSPLCKMNDFYAICPPFHYLVFGQKWLEAYFEQNTKWKVVSIKCCSDFTGDSDMWCDYASKTAPSFQLRATAEILKVLMQSEENKKLLLDNNIGTEIIMAIQKK